MDRVKPTTQTKDQIKGELNMAATQASNVLGFKLLKIAMVEAPTDNATVVHALMQALGSAIGNCVKPDHLSDMLVDVNAEVERVARATLTLRVNLAAAAGVEP